MKKRWMAIVGLSMTFLQGSVVADYSVRGSVKAYVDELVAEHQFEREALWRLFSDAEKQPAILEAIARPAEKTWEWHEYRGLFLQEVRIEEGVKFWQENEAALLRAEDVYGVAPEIVVAIIGVETRYGRIKGRHRVLDALSTLAFDYPPRAKFFRKELTEFLLLAREESKDPREPVGSYAGAMGYGQFIPSSYRHYAVDFDEDGVRDIWDNRTDAIGSVANYFARHGWRGEAELLVPVSGDAAKLDALANQSLALKHTVADLRQQGIEPGVALPDDTKATLFRFVHEDGPEYRLALNDFYVITRYNHSRLYARAVLELSQAIQQRHSEST